MTRWDQDHCGGSAEKNASGGYDGPTTCNAETGACNCRVGQTIMYQPSEIKSGDAMCKDKFNPAMAFGFSIFVGLLALYLVASFICFRSLMRTAKWGTKTFVNPTVKYVGKLNLTYEKQGTDLKDSIVCKRKDELKIRIAREQPAKADASNKMTEWLMKVAKGMEKGGLNAKEWAKEGVLVIAEHVTASSRGLLEITKTPVSLRARRRTTRSRRRSRCSRTSGSREEEARRGEAARVDAPLKLVDEVREGVRKTRRCVHDAVVRAEPMRTSARCA